jgi:Protein of unknown function (DUF3072)
LVECETVDELEPEEEKDYEHVTKGEFKRTKGTEEWAAGEAEAPALKPLSNEANEVTPEKLTMAEASIRIDALQKTTGRHTTGSHQQTGSSPAVSLAMNAMFATNQSVYLKRSTALNQANKEDDDCCHQQDVNEPADGVGSYHSQQPQHDEYYCNGFQHNFARDFSLSGKET